MANITETPDSTGAGTPLQSISVGDTFVGNLYGADDADNVAVDLESGLTYTLVLEGLGAADHYDLYFASTIGSQADGEGVVAGVVEGFSGLDVIWDEVDGDTLALTFVADDTGTYYIDLDRIGFADGDIDYDLTVFHGAIDNVSEGDDTIDGTSADESWDALAGDDKILAGSGNDTIIGGEGNDSLKGFHGQDIIYGGDGKDFINGQNDADYIEGNAEKDRLGGGNGNDTMLGGTGDDRVFGNLGNDYLEGNEDNDFVNGGGGNDTLNGGTGDDYLRGSVGNDIYLFESNSGADSIEDYQDGFDRIDVMALGFYDMSDFASITQIGADTEIDLSGAGDTILLENTLATVLDFSDFIFNTLADTGSSTADTMTGTAGDDWIDALQGDDIIYGLAGNDLLEGNDGKDSIDGGDDADTITGGLGNDSLRGGSGQDDIYGDGGNDSIDGEGGNDDIFGGSGKDTIYGGNGSDDIYGGTSGDVMSGGTGADTFFFESAPSSDFITDFQDGTDLLDVSALVTDGHITDFADFTLTQFGGNLVINLYNSYNLTMVGTDISEITADDFNFIA